MKPLKIVAGTLFALVAANILTWAVIGRLSALGLAAEDFEGWGALNGSDTLVVYAHYPGESEGAEWTEPGDLSEAERQRITQTFLSSGAGVAVIYRPITLDKLPASVPDKHFILAPVVQRNRPFYAHSLAVAYVPGFIASKDQRWLWLFGWRKLGEPSWGVS